MFNQNGAFQKTVKILTESYKNLQKLTKAYRNLQELTEVDETSSSGQKNSIAKEKHLADGSLKLYSTGQKLSAEIVFHSL